jgi:hypothetical protein
MIENLFQMVVSRLLVMQSEGFMQFRIFFRTFFEHDTEIIERFLFIQVFDNDKSGIFLVDDLILGLFEVRQNKRHFSQIKRTSLQGLRVVMFEQVKLSFIEVESMTSSKSAQILLGSHHLS